MRGENKTVGTIKVMVLGGLLAYGCSLLLSALCALGITGEILPLDAEAFLIPVIVLLSVFLPAYVILKIGAGGSRLLCGIGIASVYLLICVLGKLLLFPGRMDGVLRNLLCAMAGGFSAALMAAHPKARHRARYRRR